LNLLDPFIASLSSLPKPGQPEPPHRANLLACGLCSHDPSSWQGWRTWPWQMRRAGRPFIVGRHAFGDRYRASDLLIPGTDTLTIKFVGDPGSAGENPARRPRQMRGAKSGGRRPEHRQGAACWTYAPARKDPATVETAPAASAGPLHLLIRRETHKNRHPNSALVRCASPTRQIETVPD